MFAVLTALKIFAGGIFKIDFKTIMKWIAVVGVCFILYNAYSSVTDYMVEAEVDKALVVQRTIDLEKFKQQNDALIAVNVKNKVEIEKLSSSNKISLTALNELKDTTQVNKDKLVVVQKDTRAKIVVIKKKFENTPVTIESTQIQSTEISLVQINSVWDVFCDGNDNPLCKVPV
jgi:hypothetical protein